MTEQPRKKRRQRSTDRWLPRLLAVSVAVNLIAVLVLGVGSIGFIQNALRLDDTERALEKAEQALRHVEEEAVERKDADCVKDERDHFAKVNQLAQTYTFLKTADPDSDLYQAVLPQLPEIEAEARRDLAPEYCDEPNVGLPEPDPVIPPRPKNLNP